MNYGFVKVAAAVPHVEVADCFHNVRQMEGLMRLADAKGVEVMVFPELSVTAYTCMDLFAQQTLLRDAEAALLQLVEATKELDVFAVAGVPLATENKLINAAVAFQKGRILGVVPKMYVPNSREFQEERWFCSGTELRDKVIRIGEGTYPLGSLLLFTAEGVSVGIEICEDLWVPVPPGAQLAMLGADIILNLSASNEVIGKHEYRRQLVEQQSGRCIAGYVYASCGTGESTTDVVFAGSALIAENGVILKESERFATEEQLILCQLDVEHLRHDRRVNTNFTKGLRLFPEEAVHIPFALRTVLDEAFRLYRPINPAPFIPCNRAEERWEDIFRMQTAGLAKRMTHTKAETAVVGVSGGLDSTLALLVTVMTFDRLHIPRERVMGVTMPGFGTTGRTYANAVALIRSLGVTLREISIKAACEQHFKDIGHDRENHNVTYENAQARERTQILMDIANQTNGLVVGTGDLSELALGWATYNGDHISMYGVNASIPKTLVKHLVRWIADNKMDEASRLTLSDIIATPISPELIPADEQGNILQKTEDLVGPYELHDFFLYHFLRFGTRPAKIYFLAQHAFAGVYDRETIRKWMRVFFDRFFRQQFKRSCLPDGPKVGSVSLSPRCDWRMPSDASAAAWLREIANP
ncbi:Glutamine-dependent NAD(+) synthetase [Bacteroidales bacterium Barb6XT]|nr:Glutamine-dependent NAD(+) synthetase [Bacteroidales bacterium Barb6XT]